MGISLVHGVYQLIAQGAPRSWYSREQLWTCFDWKTRQTHGHFVQWPGLGPHFGTPFWGSCFCCLSGSPTESSPELRPNVWGSASLFRRHSLKNQHDYHIQSPTMSYVQIPSCSYWLITSYTTPSLPSLLVCGLNNLGYLVLYLALSLSLFLFVYIYMYYFRIVLELLNHHFGWLSLQFWWWTRHRLRQIPWLLRWFRAFGWPTSWVSMPSCWTAQWGEKGVTWRIGAITGWMVPQFHRGCTMLYRGEHMGKLCFNGVYKHWSMGNLLIWGRVHGFSLLFLF